MFTGEYLLSLKSKYSNCTVCDDLQTELQAILPPLTKTISSGDVMTDINNSLDRNGYCFIGLADSHYGTVMQHYFTLFNTQDGLFRLESYSDYLGEVYGPRLVEWSTYEYDLLYLLNLAPGNNRVMYWNGLFNSREDKDALNEMVIDINFKTYELKK